MRVRFEMVVLKAMRIAKNRQTGRNARQTTPNPENPLTIAMINGTVTRNEIVHRLCRLTTDVGGAQFLSRYSVIMDS